MARTNMLVALRGKVMLRTWPEADAKRVDHDVWLYDHEPDIATKWLHIPGGNIKAGTLKSRHTEVLINTYCY
jgi:hypothetical protein